MLEMPIENTNIFSNRPKIFRDRNILSPTYIPKILRYRDRQFEELKNYFGYVLDGSPPPHLLLLGFPGTGKTVTLRKVLEALSQTKEVQNNFKIGYTVAIKGGYQTTICLAQNMGLPIPSLGLSFQTVWSSIDNAVGDKIGIFVIDEIDRALDDTGERLLYCLSRRPKTAVIGVSNKLSIYEKIKDPGVKSSYVPYKIVFPPYNAEELNEILKDRLEEAFYPQVIDEAVIRKIAAIATLRGGDARYALDLLLSCGDIAVQHKSTKITEELVDEARDHLELAYIKKAIVQLHIVQKLLLYIVLRQKSNTPSAIYNEYNSLAEKIGSPRFTSRRLGEYMEQLEFLGFVDLIKKGKGRGQGFKWEVRIASTMDTNLLYETLKQELSEYFTFPTAGEQKRLV
jgi:cell division control protein 6